MTARVVRYCYQEGLTRIAHARLFLQRLRASAFSSEKQKEGEDA